MGQVGLETMSLRKWFSKQNWPFDGREAKVVIFISKVDKPGMVLPQPWCFMSNLCFQCKTISGGGCSSTEMKIVSLTVVYCILQ